MTGMRRLAGAAVVALGAVAAGPLTEQLLVTPARHGAPVQWLFLDGDGTVVRIMTPASRAGPTLDLTRVHQLRCGRWTTSGGGVRTHEQLAESFGMPATAADREAVTHILTVGPDAVVLRETNAEFRPAPAAAADAAMIRRLRFTCARLAAR